VTDDLLNTSGPLNTSGALHPDEPLEAGGVGDWDSEVWCPHCGEPGTVLIDPLGGGHQQYVQDCEVCCRPWAVTVRLDSEGGAAVDVNQEDA
jgi:hypothetical protein